MALTGVGAVRTPTNYIAGAVSGASVANGITTHLPVWKVGGQLLEMAALSATAAANDSGYVEVPAWESAQLITGDLDIDVSQISTDQFPNIRVIGGNATGSINGMALTSLTIANNTNITGSINGMALTSLVIANNTSITGSINGMALTSLVIANNTNITGSINGMALTFLDIVQNSSISGNLNSTLLAFLRLDNAPSVIITSPPVFAGTMSRIFIRGSGLTQQMIDWVLESAAEVSTWIAQRQVFITENATASAAGMAFIPIITANGATVTVN